MSKRAPEHPGSEDAQNSQHVPASASRSSSPSRTILTIVDWVLLAPFGVLLITYLVRSLFWRMDLDVPLAHYSAFMRAEYGTAPYKDLFEISFPGTIIMHLGITRLFGYGDSGLMLANLLWWFGTAVITYKLMAIWGARVSWASILVFGFSYFRWGNTMMMQRDCIVILPIAIAILLFNTGRLTLRWRRALIGLLIGCASVIKPHMALALLPFLVREICDLLRPTSELQADRIGVQVALINIIVRGPTVLSPYILGMSLPVVVTFAWLYAAGGLAAWHEMTQSYLPIYLSMTGSHETIQGFARIRYVIHGLAGLGGLGGWLLAVGVGSFVAISNVHASTQRARTISILIGEAVAFALYPGFAGQFWDYHYMPLTYFLVLLASLCMMHPPSVASQVTAWYPRLALALTLGITMMARGPLEALRPTNIQGHAGTQVDDMAGFLRTHLRPGDTVQPLDWTGGAVHAMLIARAKLATPFMYDYHFYHHVSRPFIQLLRTRFIQDFQKARPRFVVQYFGETKPWPKGYDTTREFPKLQAMLASDYEVKISGLDYRILELRGNNEAMHMTLPAEHRP
jgi:hypothetical protein